jgi:Tfp pilus assembly protein PilV
MNNSFVKQPNNNEGYAVLDVVLTVLVLVAAVGAFLTYQAHMKAQNAPTTTAAADTSASKVDAMNAKQSQLALANVKAFYKAYLLAPGVPSLSSWEQKGYITSEAAADATGKSYDTFTCSQNPLSYGKYSFSTPAVNGSTATMAVSGTYSGPPPATTVIHLGLKLVNSNWEINAVSCPSTSSK